MKKLLLGMAMILMGCASPGGNANYKGADAGLLAMSIGYTQPAIDYYSLSYRRVGDPRTDAEFITGDAISIHTQGDIFRTIDYEGADTGSVVTESLAPGEYEIYGVHANDQSGAGFFSKRVFSLRFVIKPRQTTYIGSYTAMLVMTKQHSWLLGDYDGPGAAYFVVSDMHERDLAIAGKREPNLFPATIAVPGKYELPAPYFTTGKLN